MKMYPFKFLSQILLFFVMLPACASGIEPGVPGTPQSTNMAATATVASTEIPVQDNMTITLWVAPEFAPDSNTAAGALLAERLQSFEAQYPRVDVKVRVKNARGQGGLLDALVAANSAAPSTLPDLITLDPAGLRFSVTNDLIVPLDELLESPEDPEWYEFATDAAWVDGEFISFPFASHTDVLAYSPDNYEAPPSLWEDLIRAEQPFLFPAGDPEAVFTIGQYLSLDGELTDDNGQPMLDQGVLTEVLSIYEATRDAGVLSRRALSYQNSTETAEELAVGGSASSIAPLIHYLSSDQESNVAALPAPSPDQLGIAMTETWSWGIVARDPDRQALLAELITWLNEPTFLGAWTRLLGMLPPTSAALNAWPEGDESALASSLVTLSIPKPSDDILEILGEPLMDAVTVVIEGVETPAAAASQAIEALQQQ